MKITYHLFTVLAAVLALSACQKVIDVKVNTSPSQMVIEGNITNLRELQVIKLSRSVAYTQTNTYPAVTGAKVVVTDNLGTTWTFTETTPGTYTFGPVRGQVNRTYTLSVNTDNATYTAASTMPATVKVDSLSLASITFGGKTRRHVAVHYNDPRGIANQYRYVLFVNGRQTKSIFVADDRLTDGNVIKDELFPVGADDSDEDEQDLKSGDEAVVVAQDIDRNVFNYFYAIRQQKRGGPGGGVTPGNPPSNISNNALGYFSAHTYQSLKLVVP